MIKKKVVYYTDRQFEGIEYAAKVIDFGVSLTVAVAVALNELYTAHMMLRERKDLYRRDVKRLANIAIDKAKYCRGQMLSTMRSRKYFDAYSDKAIDLAENDVTMYRISIKQTLDDNGVEDSDLIAYIETARTVLDMARVQFDEECRHTKEEYADYDYALVFAEFNCSDVLNAWQKVCDILYARESNIDLNTDKNLALFNAMAKKFADGVFVDECMREAHEVCPEFIENAITKTEN